MRGWGQAMVVVGRDGGGHRGHVLYTKLKHTCFMEEETEGEKRVLTVKRVATVVWWWEHFDLYSNTKRDMYKL